MNKAWMTGYLTRHQMENEHPLELEEMENDFKNGTSSHEKEKNI